VPPLFTVTMPATEPVPARVPPLLTATAEPLPMLPVEPMSSVPPLIIVAPV
jgi:hypothetical protein